MIPFFEEVHGRREGGDEYWASGILVVVIAREAADGAVGKGQYATRILRIDFLDPWALAEHGTVIASFLSFVFGRR